MRNEYVNGFTLLGIASSEPIRVAGLESSFEGHTSIRTIAGSLDSLLTNLDVCYFLMDLSCNPAWMEVQYMVKRVRPDVRQIVLGPAGNEELILRSISAGARAYLDASAGPLAVRQAVESVMQGLIWAPRRTLSQLIDRLLGQANVSTSAQSAGLSPREGQVLKLIMGARSNREIAVELGIEERTVKAYVANLLRKTGAENRVLLSVRATQDVMRDQRSQLS